MPIFIGRVSVLLAFSLGVRCAPSAPSVTSSGLTAHALTDLDRPLTLDNVDIVLPADLARFPCRGQVTLGFVVLPDGRVDTASTRVVSANDSLLIEPIRDAVHRSRFDQPLRDGVPVPAAVVHTFQHQPNDAPIVYDDECLGTFRTAEMLGRIEGCYDEAGSRSLERGGANARWRHFPATQEHFLTFFRNRQLDTIGIAGIWETPDSFRRIGHNVATRLGVPTRIAIVPQCGVEGWEYGAIRVDYHPSHRAGLDLLIRRRTVSFVLRSTPSELEFDLQFFRDAHRFDHTAERLGEHQLTLRGPMGIVGLTRVFIPDSSSGAGR